MSYNKRKGTRAEVGLCNLFNSYGFRAVRVAGSGVMEKADCDVIAASKKGKYCIEVKSTKKNLKYISKDQVRRFLIFAEISALTPVIALRFNSQDWIFIYLSQLRETSKNYVITLETAKEEGHSFEGFFGLESKESLVDSIFSSKREASIK